MSATFKENYYSGKLSFTEKGEEFNLHYIALKMVQRACILTEITQTHFPAEIESSLNKSGENITEFREKIPL